MAHLSLCRTWRPLGYAVCSVEFPRRPGFSPLPLLRLPSRRSLCRDLPYRLLFRLPALKFPIPTAVRPWNPSWPRLNSSAFLPAGSAVATTWGPGCQKGWSPEMSPLPVCCCALSERFRRIRFPWPATHALRSGPLPLREIAAAPGMRKSSSPLPLTNLQHSRHGRLTGPGQPERPRWPPCEWTGADRRLDGVGRGAP